MSMQQSEARRERLREERAEAKRLGVPIQVRTTVDKAWTSAEEETLRRLYPDYQAAHDVMRHRSYFAIRGQARKMGLVVKRHVWTTGDFKRLKELWSTASPADLRAAFPGLSLAAVIRQGRTLNLGARWVAPIRPTGDLLCDAVRARCLALGYSMPQLDTMAGTGTYFQKAKWLRKGGHRWWPMVKAAKMLGGELRVKWPDDGESVDTIDVGEG